MSDIWTRCAGDSELRPLRLDAWRFVEAQHQVSTRKLVDTLGEQALLEDLIEAAKPADPGRARLHYLLATPFRYPPLRHGSRFGSRHDPGIWYGSMTVDSAAAEVAYYRVVFLEGTRADLGTVTADLTAFTAGVRTAHGADLGAAPFAAYRAAIASPADYRETQALGRRMRQAGVEAFRYPSARHAGGVNVGVLSPVVFRRDPAAPADHLALPRHTRAGRARPARLLRAGAPRLRAGSVPGRRAAARASALTEG